MGRLKHIVKWIFNPFLVKKPEHVKVVVLCIAVATTFWFFIAFNKTYTTIFSYPINYKYNQEKFTPINTLKSNVRVSLTGQGWDLLKEYFSLDKKYIDIQLADKIGLETIRASQFEASANELFKKVTVNEILVDSINCNLDYKISKLIVIDLPKDSIVLNNGYAISSVINIEPKEIHISGPASIINQINDTFQLSLLEEIDDDFDDEVALNLPKKVVCDVEEVTITFDLSPYIEIEKEFTYLIVGNEDSTITFNPQKIIGNYYIPENLENEVHDSLFIITLDVKDFIFEHDTSLAITTITKPDFVRRVVLEDTLIQITRKDD